MLLLPVLDLQANTVVRGIAGRRSEYRPLQSRLTPFTDPLRVARAFRDHFGLTTLYLADLDAIGGKEPAYATYESLARDGFALWVDAGLREVSRVPSLRERGVETVVAGLETMPRPEVFQELPAFGKHILVSLDMKDGQPLTPWVPWRSLDMETIAEEIHALGLRRFLVLDLGRVGMGRGTGTENVCRRLIQRWPGEVELYTGGGVRGMEDLSRIQALGAAGILVASALHDGTITREHVG